MTDEELAEVLEEIRGCPPMFRHKEDNNMSDYRYDILGHGGLSKASGTFTMASANSADKFIKGLNGKNLFHNGKPHQTVSNWDGTVENSPNGWTRITNASKGENILFDTLAGQYFHVKFDAKVSSSKPGLVQFEKEYKRNSSVYLDGACGGEIKDIIGGQDVTLSLEVKTNQPIYVHKQLMVQFNDGTSNLTILDPSTSVSNPPVVLPEDDWKKLTVTGKMPDAWQSLIKGTNVKAVVLMINIYLRDSVTEVISGVEYWMRNVKLEYGTEATDYSYSDWDEGYLAASEDNVS